MARHPVPLMALGLLALPRLSAAVSSTGSGIWGEDLLVSFVRLGLNVVGPAILVGAILVGGYQFAFVRAAPGHVLGRVIGAGLLVGGGLTALGRVVGYNLVAGVLGL